MNSIKSFMFLDQKKFKIPVSQRLPVYPGKQAHRNPPLIGVHSPLF